MASATPAAAGERVRDAADMFDGQGPVIAAVSAGGALGALARWGVGVALPGAGPWATFGINVLGCLLIGVLVAVLTDVVAAPALVRALLGTGVLDGFTTFSGYALDDTRLLTDGRTTAAALYLTATLAGAVLATHLALTRTRRATRRPR